METTAAPDSKPGYPSQGKRLGPAWEATWAALAGGEWQDGHILSQTIAPQHDLSPETLRALLYRMAAVGILSRQIVQVRTDKGLRDRTHFRRPA